MTYANRQLTSALRFREALDAWVAAEPHRSYAAIARASGLAHAQNVNHWKTRGVPGKYVERVAEILGVNDLWLMGLDDDRQCAAPVHAWETPDELSEDEYALVRYLDAEASAGNGSILYEEPATRTPQSFKLGWIRANGWRPDQLYCRDVRGDSMSPTLADGHTVLVNRADTRVQDGRVYLVRTESALSVKRLFNRVDGGLTLHPDNPAYRDVEVPAADMQHVTVLGRVVWHAGVI